ncbi:MAG: ATP-binding cassette domain-containing protein, partial [Candidatus Thiodiazotropha endolucinida]
MIDHLLKISGLRLTLKSANSRLRVVEDLDLEIQQGETFALVGESGCGKSITALSLMRLLPPSVHIETGRIDFNGFDLVGLDRQSIRRLRGGQMGMVFQEPMTSLNPLMSIGRQIAEAVTLHDDLMKSAVNRRVIELLQAVAIPDPERCIHRYPH